MVIEITATTLKRLGNYESVVRKEHAEAQKLQWRVMTLEVMLAAENARSRASHVGAAVAYARYLHRIQNGQEHTRHLYGEPQLSQALVDLMKELSIERNLVPEAEFDGDLSGLGPKSAFNENPEPEGLQ